MNNSERTSPVVVTNGGKDTAKDTTFKQYDSLHHKYSHESDFVQAMSTNGIVCSESINVDGHIHRFANKGKQEKDAWYVFFGMAGAYGDWSLNIKKKWNCHHQGFNKHERAEYHRQVKLAKDNLQQESIHSQSVVSKKVQEYWATLSEKSTSSYLSTKQVGAYGVRFDGEIVVVPLRDPTTKLWSVQTILPNGTKRFFSGGKVQGCFHLIGNITLGASIYITEGYATGASIHMATHNPVIVCFFAHNMSTVVQSIREAYPRHELILCGDDDQWKGTQNVGRATATKVAEAFQCSLIFPIFSDPTTHPTDFNDLHCLEGLTEVKRQLKTNGIPYWPEPEPINNTLGSARALTAAMLPETLRPWISDVSHRMQCPKEYVAIPALVMIGSLIGTRCCIRPKQKDSWRVWPNVWGCIVGCPGSLKSPAMEEALKPIAHLEKTAHILYTQAIEHYSVEQARLEHAAKKLSSSKDSTESNYALLAHQPVKPVCTRYKTNDTTVEKLCELLRDHPRGLLLVRDELSGLFSQWETKGHEGDRAFYLSAWSGEGSYTTDRIGRGTVHAERVCLSLMGSIQPDKLIPFVAQSIYGSGNDGLIQRFQLMVYPDKEPWTFVDEHPNVEAETAVTNVIQMIAQMAFEAYGASKPDDGVPYFQFNAEAQAIFNDWLTNLETQKLRGQDEDAFIIEHLSKYKKLLPALCLIFHILELSSGNVRGQIAASTLTLAIQWCEYLESHARRMYALASKHTNETERLFKRIVDKELEDGFTVRAIYRKKWRGLTQKENIENAVERLITYGYLKEYKIPAKFQQKEKIEYRINPKIWKTKEDD
jgi:putative DNA primase/helicase